MPTKKLSDDKIWEGYRRIMSGESLTKVAKELSTDRGILKKYIEKLVIGNLSMEQQKAFNERMSKNFRGNNTGEGRKGRDKKAKNLQSEEYIIAKQQVQEYGISEQQVNELYILLKSKKNTCYAQGTYIIKLTEFLDYFVEKGLTPMQVIDMITRRPQIFSADIRNTINPIIELLERNNREGVKEVYETPSKITKGKRRIKQENQNIENGSDKNGRILTNDAEISGDEK